MTTVNVPGCTSGKIKSPSECTFVSTRTFVSSLTSVTFAPATAPLLLSTTCPLMAALEVCARATSPETPAVNATNIARHAPRHAKILCFILFEPSSNFSGLDSDLYVSIPDPVDAIYTCQFPGGLTLGDPPRGCQILFSCWNPVFTM